VRAELPGESEQQQIVGTRHVLTLETDPAAVLGRLHRNRIQKRIRRSRELGVEVVLSRSRAELDAFYRLHCETRRRQGVPVQPRRFISSIWERLIETGLGFVVTARLDGTPVATALFLAWNQSLIYKYGASDNSYWKLGANFLVHWTAMEWGCANGFTTYDFGRTDAGHESLRAFKAGWGAEEIPLIYTHLGTRVPRPGRGRAGQALAHLIQRSPTVVCRALGEMLYRYAA
jgi:CelD/BcsL family acetyltransferase involved in cellulose biosynthesis